MPHAHYRALYYTLDCPRRSASATAGHKFDSPMSVANIPHFVEQWNISLEEVEKPLEDYATFNEFFARKVTGCWLLGAGCSLCS